MKVLFVVHHDLKTEARSAEFLECMKMYGETTLVSYCRAHEDPEVTMITNSDERRGYWELFKNARKAIREINPDIVLLHDNLFLSLLIPYLRNKCVVIYDSSELKLPPKKTKLSRNAIINRLNLLSDKKFIKKAHVIVAANKERAEIMKSYYPLDEMPIVFDNVHRIDTQYDEEACKKKFGHLFEKERFNVLYAGGVSEERLTYQMVEQIGALGEAYQFIIVGQAAPQALDRYHRLLKTQDVTNTHYLGFVSREELKYLMESASVTVSAFAMDTLNNINCASGKVYEGLFLGKPLLAGVNPPLKNLCEQHGVGISTSDFGKGCVELKNNYTFYENNVQKYIENLDYEKRIVHLKENIDARLEAQGIPLTVGE